MIAAPKLRRALVVAVTVLAGCSAQVPTTVPTLPATPTAVEPRAGRSTLDTHVAVNFFAIRKDIERGPAGGPFLRNAMTLAGVPQSQQAALAAELFSQRALFRFSPALLADRLWAWRAR